MITVEGDEWKCKVDTRSEYGSRKRIFFSLSFFLMFKSMVLDWETEIQVELYSRQRSLNPYIFYCALSYPHHTRVLILLQSHKSYFSTGSWI